MLSDALRSSEVSANGHERRNTVQAPHAAVPVSQSKERRRAARVPVRQSSLTVRPFLFSSPVAWMALDFIVCMAAGYISQAAIGRRLTVSLINQSFDLTGLPFALLVLLFSQLSGLHRAAASQSPLSVLARVFWSTMPAGLSLLGLQWLWGTVAVSKRCLLEESLLAALGMFSSRALWHRRRIGLYRRQISVRNFLVIGLDDTARNVNAYLTSLRHIGYVCRGYVDLLESKDDPSAVGDKEIIGNVHDVIELAQCRFVDEIIFSRRPSTPGVLSWVIRQAQAVGISIRLIPSITETLIDRTDVEYIGDLPTIAVFQARQRPFSIFLKRTFDIILASIALLALFPFFLIIAVAIKVQSHGPAFYVAKRVGYKGRAFNCIKFRTMINGAHSMREQLAHLNERSGALFKITKDPRVTPLGAFLRRYSLDELPQLWNVIRGDMSLVGPRPSLASEVAQYDTKHLHRLNAVPGITGLWQVEARQDPSFDRCAALDSNYINHWSLQLDLKILWRTIATVIRGTGS